MSSRGQSILLAAAGLGVIAVGAAAFVFVSGSSNQDGGDEKKTNDSPAADAKATSRSIEIPASSEVTAKASETDVNEASNTADDKATTETETDNVAITTPAEKTNGEQQKGVEPEPVVESLASNATDDEEQKVSTETEPEKETPTSASKPEESKAAVEGGPPVEQKEKEVVETKAVEEAKEAVETKAVEKQDVNTTEQTSSEVSERLDNESKDKPAEAKEKEQTAEAIESNPPMTPNRKKATEEPSTPETAGAMTDSEDDAMTSGDEGKPDIARLARLHAHHKKKPNHNPAKNSAAAKAIKELKASSNNKKKKKKKKKNQL